MWGLRIVLAHWWVEPRFMVGSFRPGIPGNHVRQWSQLPDMTGCYVVQGVHPLGLRPDPEAVDWEVKCFRSWCQPVVGGWGPNMAGDMVQGFWGWCLPLVAVAALELMATPLGAELIFGFLDVQGFGVPMANASALLYRG